MTIRHLSFISTFFVYVLTSYAQFDTIKTSYSNLDTLKFYNVSLEFNGNGTFRKYQVNGKRVNKSTYDKYEKTWENMEKCKPCYLKTYDINEKLVREGVQYTDCGVGGSIEYHENGKIKSVGQYKENTTDNWDNLWNRGYCSNKIGTWTEYDNNGSILKTEKFNGAIPTIKVDTSHKTFIPKDYAPEKTDSLVSDTSVVPAKYPYIKNRTPPLIAALIGYNFYDGQQLEIGTIINISDNSGSRFGMMLGPSLLYRRSLDRNLNAVDFDLGFYSALTFGAGLNYNFNDQNHIFGVRPFVGITLFHVQLTYGYNIFNDKKNDLINLRHHAIRLRVAIPITTIFGSYN